MKVTIFNMSIKHKLLIEKNHSEQHMHYIVVKIFVDVSCGVINGDDYYGKNAYVKLCQVLFKKRSERINICHEVGYVF